MLDSYRDNFAALTPAASALAASALARRHHLVDVPVDPSELFAYCRDHDIDQADVVMSMANDPSALAVVALETVVGRPIQRGRACLTGSAPVGQERTPPREKHVRPPAPRMNDPRKIVSVAQNPKKVGSASHARYEFYRVGMTVSEALAAGVSKEDIAWDSKKGFIEFAT